MSIFISVLIALILVESAGLWFLLGQQEGHDERALLIKELEADLEISQEKIVESEKKLSSNMDEVEQILKEDNGVKNEAISGIVANITANVLK